MPRTTKLSRRWVSLFAVASLAACAPAGRRSINPRAQARRALEMPPAPPAAPARWRGLIGEYDTPVGMRIVLEEGGELWLADTNHHALRLAERGAADFEVASGGGNEERVLGRRASTISFVVDRGDRARAFVAGGERFPRREIEPAPGTNQLRVTPVRPVEQVRGEALAASPPRESGNFKKADLVELTTLEPGIKLEIRYATTNNFLGTRFYDQPRAFMQRAAAEAVARAHRSLEPLGFGLLIHDAYRPWYVTKMFWDATPADKRWLVANPAEGSKHNRGAAVDLTLYRLSTGRPVDMPSTYDESTDRAYADYPGGTSLERWHRALLRRAMEEQGFTVNPTEWWHFDFNGWQDYAIGNEAFERIR
jgi:D-alanyl-D-alanine dipeptidase